MKNPSQNGCVERLTSREKCLKTWFLEATQSDLSNELKVSQSHFSRMFNRKNLPSLNWVEDQAASLGVRPIVLLDWIYIRMGRSQEI